MSAENDIPFPVAPPPWHCRGEAFWLFSYINPSKGSCPPSSAFADLEGESAYADSNVSGEYKGGLTMLMIVRYTDTPVGPYDEILWCPGSFIVPATGKAEKRTTRIYVSTKASVFNGRKNWNIPKHLAHFEFSPNPNAKSPKDIPYSKITLSSVSDPEHPFFAINLTSTQFFSGLRIPFSSAISPVSTNVVQPPMPESPLWRENALVGTNQWCALDPSMKGKGGLFWHTGGLEGGQYSDDKGFPTVKPWKIGVWLKDFVFDFMAGGEPGNNKSD